MIIRPIALRTKEGFGLLTGRSKSIPPIPREQAGRQQPGILLTTPPAEVSKRTYLDLSTPHTMNPLLTSNPGFQSLVNKPQTSIYDLRLWPPVHVSWSLHLLIVLLPPPLSYIS